MHIAVATHSSHLETTICRSNLRLTLSPPASLDYRGLNIAVIKDSPRGSQVDATAIQGATRESHRAEGGLDVVTSRGATLRSHRNSEGGIDVASRQARDKQAQDLNAQQAHLESEIEKLFLSGYHARQRYEDLSDCVLRAI